MKKNTKQLGLLVLLACLLGPLYAQVEVCNDEMDNDGDGLIDCFDPDCYGLAGCENFFIGQPAPDCEFTPPPIDMIELIELFRTDEVSFPIDQRAGVYIGDMNCDGIPDLVSRDNNPARIQIFSGDDGRILQSIPTGNSQAFGQVAIADVDRDGKGDIFHVEFNARLARYEFGNNSPVWRTGNNSTNDNSVGTPQIADINGDGIPEVYVGGRVYDAITGTLYATQNINNGAYAGGNNSDRFPIVYDFFQAGQARPNGGTFGAEANGLEFAAGDRVYTFTFTPGVANSGSFQEVSRLNDNTNQTGDGFTSIADINGDGRMDLAVMDGGRVYAWDPYTRMQIGSTFNIPNTNSGGRINLGDFNGDGDVELGFAGRNAYYVLELLPNGNFGILWSQTGLDDGSQRTGSTLFDFDGDGVVEVVYSEEANLYIYNGTDGTELLRIPSESGTRTEYPLVADVNGDGTAEIIVTAQDGNGPSFSGNGWVTVYTSANQPWVPTRPVWNQHGYNVVNVNDDLTIPAVQQDPLNPAIIDEYNNFLVQTPLRTQSGVGNFPAADAIIEPSVNPINNEVVLDFSQCPQTVSIDLEIDNAGAASLPASTPISFYQGDPSVVQATLIDVITIGIPIDTGAMVTITRNIDVSAFAGTEDLDNVFMVINDPGFAMADLPFDLATDFPVTGTAECIYTNNLSFIGSLVCVEICDDTGDNDGDGLVDEPNITAPVTTGCPGETLPAFTTDVGNVNGTYSVGTPNPSGTTVDANGIVTLGTNVTVYPTLIDIIFDDGRCLDTVTVMIDDSEPPSLVCPGDQMINVDANCDAAAPDLLPSIQLSDNCSANSAITLSQSPVTGAALSLGSNSITITATDEAGNVNNCTTNVMVVDGIDPVLNCIASTSVVADANCQGTIPDLSAQTNATDNCSNFGNLTITQIPAAGSLVNSTANNATQTVQVRVTDEAGNEATCSINVQVLDQEAPVVTCPAPITLTLDPTSCSVAIGDYRSLVMATDNCSSTGQIQLTQNPSPGTVINTVGVTTVTITAEDQAGNLNSTGCAITVATVDNTAPILSCPPAVMAEADATDCSVMIADVTTQVQATDNCSSVTLSQLPAAATTFNADTEIVTVTATDASGNSITCAITVQRKDVTEPTITCPATQQENLDASCQFTLPDYTGLATANDNCTASPSVSQSPAVGTVITSDQTITLTATDEAGNTTTCTFLVALNDVTPPSISCPVDQLIGVDGNCDVPLPDYTGNGSASDNCSAQANITVAQGPPAGTLLSGDGTTQLITLTPTDEAGNVGPACTFTVTLEDQVPPSITCPASPQTDFLDVDCQAAIPDFRSEVDVSSMCSTSGIILTQSPAPGTIVTGHNTLTEITITADDGNGNLVSCTFDYLVLDNTPPVLDCRANTSEIVDANCAFSLPDYTGTQDNISDNCDALGQLTLTQTPPAGTSISGAGTSQTITIMATDQAGNTSMCTFEVILEDELDPVVSCPTNIAALEADGTCEVSLPDYTMASSTTDNCTAPAAIALTQSPASGTVLSGAGTTQLVTITATDESNNQATCTFTVAVADNIAPTITCPPAREITVDANCMALVPNLVPDASALDNCTATAAIAVTQDIAPNTVLSGPATTQTVTLTADDGNGNTVTCTVALTLQDETPPVITCPVNQDFTLDASCEGVLPDFSSQLAATDNCTPMGSLAVTQSPLAGTMVSGANTIIPVTFTVDDNNGNTENCTFQVTLADETPPTVNCPVDQVLSPDADCMAIIPNYTGLATPSDACTMSGLITLTQSPGAGTILTGDNQMATVTITADDGNGNTANCTFNVTTADNTPPTIGCPDNQAVAVDANCAFNVPDYTANATLHDNCSENVDITVTQSPLATTLTALNTPATITLTATDQAGNAANCTFTVTPLDQTDPDIVCPSPQVIYYDAACSVDLPDFTAAGTPADNCSAANVITVTQSPVINTTYTNLMPPLVTVTLTAEDESGNTNSCDFTVNLRDTIAPILTCPNDTIIALDVDCNGELPDLTDRVQATENCSPNSLTVLQSPDPGSVFSGDGTEVEVTFTVIDSDGNQSTCITTVTFEDMSPPNPVTCPTNQTLTTDDVCPIALPDFTPNATVIDNCRAQDEIILTQSPTPDTMIMGNGTVVPVTITADDGNGNTANCTFTVSLVDNVPVNLACPGGQIVIASSDNCDAELPDFSGDATVTNECMSPAAGVTFTQAPTAGTIIQSSQLDLPQTVTLTAQDINGNLANCTFTVTMIDTLAPMLTCPSDDVRSVDASCQHLIRNYLNSVTVADNCSAAGDISLQQTPAEGTLLPGPDNSQEITVTATDESGNLATCTFNVTIQDVAPPNVQCPAPDTLFVNAACEATIPDYTSQAVILDNCTAIGDMTVNQTPAAGTVLSGDDTNQTITITATDASGNTNSCSFDINLQDTIPPSILCPGDQVINPDANCDALIGDYRNLATTDDNCATTGITVLQSPLPGTVLNRQGAGRTVTLTADDGHGNTENCTFAVQLVDNVAPLIACPPDTTVEADANCDFALPDLRASTSVSDNCTAVADIIITQSPGVGFTLNGDGDFIEAIFTADDSNGNTAQCSYRITLDDVTPPTIQCPPNDTIFADASCGAIIPDFTTQATVADNCTEASAIQVTQDPAPGTALTGPQRTTTITLTADDGNGNTETCDFILQLLDNTPPSIGCPAEQIIFTDANCEVDLPDYTDLATVTDNCTDPTAINVTQNPTIGMTFSALGVNTITLTANDGNGNTASCDFLLTVADNTPPELVCPATSVIPGDANCTITLADYRDSVTVTDNCAMSADIQLTQTAPSGTMITGLGTRTDVTIVATDPSGNAVNCNITVEVADTSRPLLVCLNDTTLAVDANCAARVPDYTGLPTIADNCDATNTLAVTQTPTAGTIINTEGTVTEITLTVTDASGNAQSCSFDVTLIDTLSPVVICPDNDVISVDGTCSISLPDYTGSAQPTDNCTDPGMITLAQMPAPGLELSGDGTSQEMTITATDASGNAATCVFSVSLEDTTEPMITCPTNQALTLDGDCNVVLPDYTDDATVSSTCDQGDMIAVTQSPDFTTTILSGHNTTQIVTLTATDGSGNNVSCSFTVTTFDREDPVIIDCPGDLVDEVDASCNFTIPDYWATTPVTATDNCTPTGTTATTATGNQLVYTQDPAPGTVLNGAFTRQTITLTVNDGNGNSVSCNFDLQLRDTIAPEIPLCASDTIANPDASCSFTLEDYRNRINPTDNCTETADLTIVQDPPAGTQLMDQGTEQEVTLTITDASGNTVSCSFTLTLQDTISPSISCPQDKVELLDSDCAFAVPDYTNEAVVADNCTDADSIAVSQQPAVGTIFTNENTVIPVTLTADDGNGNTTTCTFNVTLDDNVPPVINCPADTIIPVDAACSSALPDLTGRTTATDNCAPDVSGNSITITQLPAAGTVYTDNGTTIEAILTADDSNGNTVSCVVRVTLQDTISPMISCPANDTIFTDASCTAEIPDYRTQAAVTDNCTPNGMITVSQLAIPGTEIMGHETLETITLAADDGNGNTNSCTFTLRLLDDDPPSISCPATQTQFGDTGCEILVEDYTGLATTMDNCTPAFGGMITVTQLPAAGTSFSGVQDQTVTLTADDGNGNTMNCTFQLNIRDNVPPQLTCPPTQTEFADASCTVTLADYRNLATATDNCIPPNTPASLSLTQTAPPGTTFSGFGQTLDVTITARDSSGNSSFCVFTVELSDTISPTIVCPLAQDIFADADCETTLPDYRPDATGMDNCDNATTELSYVQDPAPGFPLSGANTTQNVNITVTDRSGNTAACAFMVTVQDTISPSIICPPRDTISVDGMCPVTLDDYTGSADVSDNCTDATAITVSQLPAAGTSFMNNPPDPNTIIAVTLTADDGNGNTSDCTFEVELIDQTDPTIVCPGRQTLVTDADCEATIPDYTSLADANSVCGAMSSFTITQTPPAGVVTLMGDSTIQEVTLRATDLSGNFAECTFEVILLDETAPLITSCPPPAVAFVDGTCEVSLPDYRSLLTATDNCEMATDLLVDQSPAPGTIFSGDDTEVTVTFTVDDTNGNTTSCTATVILQDTISPSLVCPPNTEVFTDANCEGLIPDFTGAAIGDNCTPVANLTITQLPLAGTVLSGQGSQEVVTLTVDDGNGNSTNCNLTVTLLDDDDPSISCPPSTTIESGTDCQFTLPDYVPDATVTDNCAPNLLTVTQSPSPDSILNDLNTTVEVVLTVTDGNNNQDQCSFFVTTTSATPPPAPLTVTLEGIPDVTGGNETTFDLADALNPMAETNTTNLDLDGDLAPGPGPYQVAYYNSVADANAENNALPNPTTFLSGDGGAVIVRLEDPQSGCFTISQILLVVRPQGTSELAAELIHCNRGPFLLEIDGMAAPANPNASLTHQWRIIDAGSTRINDTNLLTPTEEVLRINTQGLRSGFLLLEYQFFEDFGNGPVVPSVPQRVRVEIQNVGTGTFPWGG